MIATKLGTWAVSLGKATSEAFIVSMLVGVGIFERRDRIKSAHMAFVAQGVVVDHGPAGPKDIHNKLCALIAISTVCFNLFSMHLATCI